jgi:hypothetical protein
MLDKSFWCLHMDGNTTQPKPDASALWLFSLFRSYPSAGDVDKVRECCPEKLAGRLYAPLRSSKIP